MLKKLMLGVALTALATSGALAQSPMSPAKSSNEPAAQTQTPPKDQPAAQQQPKDQSATPSATTGAAPTSASTSAKFIDQQKPDQWLASKFKGTDVVGSDDKKIGDVSDILFDKAGKVEAFVISVGGFLGVGSKEVALAPESFQVIPGSNGAPDKLKLATTKDELKQAQKFTRYEAPHATTTGQGSSGMRPSGGMGAAGMKPSATPTTPATPPSTPPATNK